MRYARPPGDDTAGGDPICAVSRRRSGLGGPVCHDDRVASVRKFYRPDWHWPAARGDGDAGRAVGAGTARDRVGDAVASAKFGLKAVFEGLRTARGIIRSLRIYYGDRSRAVAMDRLY